MADFIFLGSKITADGDCRHEIKRRLLLGRKVMTNLDSIFKSRDITLPTKVHLVKDMVFPVVISSVQFSHSVMSDSLQPHESQHARPPCPSPVPEFTQSCVHRVSDAIQPSHSRSSPSPPAPNPSQHQSFPMSQLFAWGGQSTGVSALASFLPKDTQGCRHVY